MEPAQVTPLTPGTIWLMVHPEPAGQFTAQVLGLPESQRTAASRDEAIRQVNDLLQFWVAEGQLVPAAIGQPNPVLNWCGWARNDPDYADFLEGLRRFREQDQVPSDPQEENPECSTSSLTPATRSCFIH